MILISVSRSIRGNLFREGERENLMGMIYNPHPTPLSLSITAHIPYRTSYRYFCEMIAVIRWRRHTGIYKPSASVYIYIYVCVYYVRVWGRRVRFRTNRWTNKSNQTTNEWTDGWMVKHEWTDMNDWCMYVCMYACMWRASHINNRSVCGAWVTFHYF